MSPLRFVLAVGATALLACATRRPAATDAAPDPASTTDAAAEQNSGGSRVVTRDMILRWNVTDAYEAIERSGGYRLADNNRGDVSVRRRRGQTSVNNSNSDRPVLLLDGTIMRDFVMLRQIPAAQIERIEFLSSTDAAQRFGTSSSGAGAIIVVTRGRL